MDPMMASIMMFGGTFAPRQWAFCEGQLLAISSNTALFSLLGTTWGGDGRTTFALPDMRGRAPIGKGGGPGLTPRREGQMGGQEFVTLTQAEMPVHNHAASTSGLQARMPANSGDGTSDDPTNRVMAKTVITASGRSGEGKIYADSGDGTMAAGAVSGDVTIGNAGGGQSHQNMQPFLAVPFIIAVQGIFPSRN
jgi:microcystin-dependent protein